MYAVALSHKFPTVSFSTHTYITVVVTSFLMLLLLLFSFASFIPFIWLCRTASNTKVACSFFCELDIKRNTQFFLCSFYIRLLLLCGSQFFFLSLLWFRYFSFSMVSFVDTNYYREQCVQDKWMSTSLILCMSTLVEVVN